MKKFVPGEIARAEDVNANFAELRDSLDQLLGGIQIGEILINYLQPGEASNTYTVTFPKPFKKPPKVFMQSQNQRLNLAAWDITATSFKWMAHNNTGATSAPAGLMWVAIAL